MAGSSNTFSPSAPEFVSGALAVPDAGAVPYAGAAAVPDAAAAAAAGAGYQGEPGAHMNQDMIRAAWQKVVKTLTEDQTARMRAMTLLETSNMAEDFMAALLFMRQDTDGFIGTIETCPDAIGVLVNSDLFTPQAQTFQVQMPNHQQAAEVGMAQAMLWNQDEVRTQAHAPEQARATAQEEKPSESNSHRIAELTKTVSEKETEINQLRSRLGDSEHTCRTLQARMVDAQTVNARIAQELHDEKTKRRELQGKRAEHDPRVVLQLQCKLKEEQDALARSRQVNMKLIAELQALQVAVATNKSQPSQEEPRERAHSELMQQCLEQTQNALSGKATAESQLSHLSSQLAIVFTKLETMLTRDQYAQCVAALPQTSREKVATPLTGEPSDRAMINIAMDEALAYQRRKAGWPIQPASTRMIAAPVAPEAWSVEDPFSAEDPFFAEDSFSLALANSGEYVF